MFAKSLCLGSPCSTWSSESIPSSGGLISLLIEPLTGYARILRHNEDQIEMARCQSLGFLIAETLAYSDRLSRSECRIILSNTLKERRANLDWVNAVEELPSTEVPDIISIPRAGDEDIHQRKSLLANLTIRHYHLCATIDGD